MNGSFQLNQRTTILFCFIQFSVDAKTESSHLFSQCFQKGTQLKTFPPFFRKLLNPLFFKETKPRILVPFQVTEQTSYVIYQPLSQDDSTFRNHRYHIVTYLQWETILLPY